MNAVLRQRFVDAANDIQTREVLTFLYRDPVILMDEFLR